MPPNPYVGVAAAALLEIGYVREWGDPVRVQLFVKYGSVQGDDMGALHDDETLTVVDIVDSLKEQGVNMPAFFAAIARLDEE